MTEVAEIGPKGGGFEGGLSPRLSSTACQVCRKLKIKCVRLRSGECERCWATNVQCITPAKSLKRKFKEHEHRGNHHKYASDAPLEDLQKLAHLSGTPISGPVAVIQGLEGHTGGTVVSQGEDIISKGLVSSDEAQSLIRL